MKVLCLIVLVAFAAMPRAWAADRLTVAHGYGTRPAYPATAARRPPLALRTLSRRSESVMASTPCWRGCTTQCGWHFQGCLKLDWPAGCLAHNNACELYCLRQCRLLGGPLVSWTDY